MQSSRGFTLVETLIVVVIIALLTVIAVPRYTKSIESSRAEDAMSLSHMIGVANRIYAIDRGGYASGALSDACLTASCVSAPTSAPCNLMACGQLAKQGLSGRFYDFFAADGSTSATDPCGLGATAGNYVACAKRQAGASAPYDGWGYTVNRDGLVQAWPATNGPPSPP